MKPLQTIIAVARREMNRIIQHKIYAVMLTVLPLVALLFFAIIFSKGHPDNLPIVVVDNDHSSLSRQFLTMVDAAPEVLIRYSASNTAEAEQMIRQGDAHALLLIPAGFERDILGVVPTHIEAYISGANILINGLTAKSLLTVTTTFATGIQIQLLTSQGLTSRQALTMAMPISFEQHTLFNPYINYSYYLSPSFMPMMLLIFTMLATIFAIGSELRYGSAIEWIASANGSIVAALAGKLLPTALAMTTLSFLMFFLQFKVIGVPLNGSFTILVAGCIVFIISYMCIAITLVALTADMRLALSLGGGYAVMAFSFSGLTFPLMAMHRSLQIFSHLFPFSYFTDIVIDQAIRGAPPARSLYDIGYMMIFWALPLFTLRRLRRIATDKNFWERL